MLSKKPLLILFIVVIIIVPACKKKEAVKYVDEKYNYTFAPPDNWKDNYYVKNNENMDNYIEICFKSKIKNKETGKIYDPVLMEVYIENEVSYLEAVKDSWFFDYIYIEHPKKDLGFLVNYPENALYEEERELLLSMLEDVKPDNIKKYLFFTDVDK